MLIRLGKGAKFSFLALWLFFTIFPIYWMLLTSVKPKREVNDLYYLPKSGAGFESYRVLFRDYQFDVFLRNSLLVSFFASAIVIAVGLLGAYALARYSFTGKSQIMLGFLATQMIPGLIALAPLYLMMQKLGLINSLIGLTLAYVGGMIPFSTLMLRGFIQRIPPELDEAALIDGCNRFTALFRVVAPVALPGIAATFIFSFVACWNELFLAMILIDSEGNKTFPVAMRSFIGGYWIEWGSLSAAVMIGILPTILIFGVMSKFMISGLTAGIVKG
jgi:multiple sugar transport system permease protein